MMTMTGRLGLVSLLGAVVASTSPLLATPLAAQTEQACRCVDRDGNDVERCTCFRAPQVEGLMNSFTFQTNRARLGISVQFGQDSSVDADGVQVSDVLDGGPADDAGLEEGDVIVRLDGRLLTEPIDADEERSFDLDGSIPAQRLLALAGDFEAGQEVDVEYLRDGRVQTTTITAEEVDGWGVARGFSGARWDASELRGQLRTLTDGLRGTLAPRDSRSRETFVFPDDAHGPSRLRLRTDGPSVSVFGGASGIWGGAQDGLRLTTLNEGLGAYFGADRGVLVLEADRRSSLGLVAGDVVQSLGDRAVDTPERLRRVLASYGQDEDITFHIMRDGAETTIVGRLRY